MGAGVGDLCLYRPTLPHHRLGITLHTWRPASTVGRAGRLPPSPTAAVGGGWGGKAVAELD